MTFDDPKSSAIYQSTLYEERRKYRFFRPLLIDCREVTPEY
jgi:hypothetical protein